MCLVLLAWRAEPRFPLVVAANRDEFFARPTAPAGFWDDAPQILAGRDLEAGGTWMGITRNGRFAALTNYRDPQRNRDHAPSRGELVARFLRGEASAADYVAELARESGRYNGFNLLVGERDALCYHSNVSGEVRSLGPGVYGLSNHLLDTPWPKVARGKSALSRALAQLPEDEPLMALLRDDHLAADDELPRTGVSLEWERLLSAAFIRSPTYGTRCSTVVIAEANGEWHFDELSYDERGAPQGRARFRLSPAPAGGASPGDAVPPR